MYRRGIRLLLMMVCLMVMAAAVAYGGPEEAQPLTLNSPMELEIQDGETVWLYYTPQKSGTYYFCSDTDGDPCCSLYAGNQMEMIGDADDEEGSDFYLTADLTEGITYYFSVYAYQDSQGTVTLGRDTLFFVPVGQEEREVEYGARVVLEGEADSETGNEITYAWSDEDGEPLEGDSTGAQYVIDSFTSPRTSYFCEASDGVQSKWIAFTVWFDNHLEAHAENDAVYVYGGEPAVMKVIAECDHGNGLSYLWSYDTGDYEYDEDSGETVPIMEYLDETGEELTVSDFPGSSSRAYYCRVADDFGNTKTVDFMLYSDNGLRVKNKGEITRKVPLHGDEILEVEVFANRGGYTIEWYTQDEDGEETPIPGETTERLTLSDVTGPETYYCRVTDEYENAAEAEFRVRIDTKLSVKPIGATRRNVQKGDDVTLEVEASCENANFQMVWSEWSDDEDDFVELGTGTSLTLENVQSRRTIECICTDEYSNRVGTAFTIYVNSYFQASTPATVQLAYGGRAQLGVEFTGNSEISQDDFEYYWEYSEDQRRWESADNDDGLLTYTTEQLVTTTYFRCTAYGSYYDEEGEDDVEITEYVYFLVEVEEPDYSEYSHNLNMLVSSFGGLPSNPTEMNYYYNLHTSETVHRNNVFRYVVIMNRDEMLEKLDGEPVVSIKRVSGTASAEVRSGQWGESNVAYQLCITQTPAEEETAKYLVRCIWDTEMWEQEFTVHFINLENNQPEEVVYLGSGNNWTETVNRPVEMEKRFGFRNQWTPAEGQEVWVSFGTQQGDDPFYNYMGSTQVSGVSRWYITTPGIYHLHVVITVSNFDVWVPATIYALREDGTIADGDTLELPSGLKRIDASAFENIGEEIVRIPDGCTEIGPRAFAASENLKQVFLPASAKDIDPSAFEDCGEVIAVVSANAGADDAAEAAENAGLTVLRR